ncbi:NUDIX domain-containing protein [Streptomyces sp. NPDC058657]|uniref:NUDIX domain-containing protein n=1 Tax=unclassified Streptomyces TaxID=2593676 RepID=UPI00365DF525
MSSLNLRHSARAVVLDEEGRILLCRCVLPSAVVWITPGGGIEEGESADSALRRELVEEVGLVVTGLLRHVWHQRLIGPEYAPGYDGVINDYFLVRAEVFEPAGSLSAGDLAAEHLTSFRWWGLNEIADHQGPELFGPGSGRADCSRGSRKAGRHRSVGLRRRITCCQRVTRRAVRVRAAQVRGVSAMLESEGRSERRVHIPSLPGSS